MSAVLDEALQLAARCLPVFPCNDQMRPTSRHGLHGASTDPATVRRLWRDSPGSLIGVPTGPVSTFSVLEIDPRHGGNEWLRRNRHRLGTRIHRTRSKGLHFLFRHEHGLQNSASKIAPGVDTHGEGGFVIWWPAHGGAIVDGPLAPWPNWLLGLLCVGRQSGWFASGDQDEICGYACGHDEGS